MSSKSFHVSLEEGSRGVACETEARMARFSEFTSVVRRPLGVGYGGGPLKQALVKD